MKTSMTLCLITLILLPMIPMPVHAYDDYEEYWVDSQNPEIQRMIRDLCKFPLEDNLWLNLRILFYALGRSFTYNKTNAWQRIPQLFRQRTGVCCDFARLYYSLLRGIGWPKHRIQMVCGPTYLLGIPTGKWHAWVEIKSPSPTGTFLELSASQSLGTLEGEQFIMGNNETMLTLPELTKERIEEMQTLGFFTRDGWIPIDPTVSVSTLGLVPFLVDLFLVFGYGVFLGTVHLDEVYPYYTNADRRNPSWENFTVTLEPQRSFNVSYLRSIGHEIYGIYMATCLYSVVNSTLPIDFKIEKQHSHGFEIIDEVSNTTSHAFGFSLPYRSNGYHFPEGLGIYWFTVYNPQTEPVNVTFDAFHECIMVWLGGDYAINQTLYDQYSNRDIGITDVTPKKTAVYQNNLLPINITVTNYGFTTETFNVTLYANTTTIDTLSNVTLTSGNSTTLIFNWNTTGVAYCNYYSIKAEVSVVPNETDTSDNIFTDGTVQVKIPGDIDGDRDVDPDDFCIFAGAYGTEEGDLYYNADCDLDGDGDINPDDFCIFAGNYGKTA